jgi:hypothetical protein
MALGEVTGGTASEIAEMKAGYKNTPKYQDDDIPFSTAYCLTAIGKQPEEYDGEQRFCKNRVSRTDDGGHTASCNFHGGSNDAANHHDNLDKLAPIKHGMKATDEHLREVFTEQDEKLYDYVMSWADTYGWPSREEDPSRYDDLEAIALAKVRNARAHDYILKEGELKRQEIYDESGNLIERDDPHALSEDVRLKRKLITDIKKQLGITPKARSRMDTEESERSAMDMFAEVASDAVLGGSDEDTPDFDPEDAVFEEENG